MCFGQSGHHQQTSWWHRGTSINWSDQHSGNYSSACQWNLDDAFFLVFLQCAFFNFFSTVHFYICVTESLQPFKVTSTQGIIAWSAAGEISMMSALAMVTILLVVELVPVRVLGIRKFWLLMNIVIAIASEKYVYDEMLGKTERGFSLFEPLQFINTPFDTKFIDVSVSSATVKWTAGQEESFWNGEVWQKSSLTKWFASCVGGGWCWWGFWPWRGKKEAKKGVVHLLLGHFHHHHQCEMETGHHNDLANQNRE